MTYAFIMHNKIAHCCPSTVSGIDAVTLRDNEAGTTSSRFVPFASGKIHCKWVCVDLRVIPRQIS